MANKINNENSPLQSSSSLKQREFSCSIVSKSRY